MKRSQELTTQYIGACTSSETSSQFSHQLCQWQEFCASEDVPSFPITPALVDLFIFLLHPSVTLELLSFLDGLRRVTSLAWVGQAGAESSMDESPLAAREGIAQLLQECDPARKRIYGELLCTTTTSSALMSVPSQETSPRPSLFIGLAELKLVRLGLHLNRCPRVAVNRWKLLASRCAELYAETALSWLAD